MQRIIIQLYVFSYSYFASRIIFKAVVDKQTKAICVVFDNFADILMSKISVYMYIDIAMAVLTQLGALSRSPI